VSAKTFAEFNEKLYYSEQIPPDRFELPGDMENARITTAEL
jgi:hypothetical protein